MSETLLDTDILSFYFKGEQAVVNAVSDYLNEFDFLTISIITYFEVIAGLQYKNAVKQLLQFEEFSTNNMILPVTETSARISAQAYASLRKKGITIGTSDLLIVGIALENDLVLATNNIKHYEPIAGLKLVNWKNQ